MITLYIVLCAYRYDGILFDPGSPPPALIVKGVKSIGMAPVFHTRADAEQFSQGQYRIEEVVVDVQENSAIRSSHFTSY